MIASSQNTILNFCIRDIIQNSKTYLTSLLAEAKRDFPHAVFEIVLAFFVFVFLLKIYFISCLLASDTEQDQNDCQKNLICALALKFFRVSNFVNQTTCTIQAKETSGQDKSGPYHSTPYYSFQVLLCSKLLCCRLVANNTSTESGKFRKFLQTPRKKKAIQSK